MKTNTNKGKQILRYNDIEICKNEGDFRTYWTVEIATKLTKKQAVELADKIYNLEITS